MSGNSLILIVVLLGVAGLWALPAFFSREARLERRRRKSHSRIISKAHGPSVKFSVRAPKNKQTGKASRR